MLSVAYAKCPNEDLYAGFRCNECCFAECRSAESLYFVCGGADKNRHVSWDFSRSNAFKLKFKFHDFLKF